MKPARNDLQVFTISVLTIPGEFIEVCDVPVDEGPDDVEHAGADGGGVGAQVEEYLWKVSLEDHEFRIS